MVAVALPGIKMWAGKQREDQVCRKMAALSGVHTAKDGQPKGNYRTKYTLLRTRAFSFPLSLPLHTHTHTNLPVVCRLVQVHYTGLGFDWSLNNLINTSDILTGGKMVKA